MPLTCDCYDGCWGDHSANWMCVEVPRSRIEAARLVNPRYPESVAATALCKEAGVPYGSYVVDGRVLSVETPNLMQLVINVLLGNNSD